MRASYQVLILPGPNLQWILLKYSLDGGKTYLTYIDPIVIIQEGMNEVRYFSIDIAGNAEPEKTAQIKIDKTAPEIKVQFSLESGLFLFSSDDTANTSLNCTDSICTVIDQAGNTTVFSFAKRKDDEDKSIEFSSISYNGVGSVFNKNSFQVEFEKKKGEVKEFNQALSMKDEEKIRIEYRRKDDQSVITDKLPGAKKTKETVSGKRFLRLMTNNGKIGYIIN